MTVQETLSSLGIEVGSGFLYLTALGPRIAKLRCAHEEHFCILIEPVPGESISSWMGAGCQDSFWMDLPTVGTCLYPIEREETLRYSAECARTLSELKDIRKEYENALR